MQSSVMQPIPPSSIGILRDSYPMAPALLKHNLVGHPLLQCDALARAALRMAPEHVERRVSDAGNGKGFPMMRQGDLPMDEVIRAIAGAESWVMLRFVEQLPEYRALIEAILEAADPAIVPRTGHRQDVKGFIFISSPGTLTPFHFDSEYNILFQIAGNKDFATYPTAPPYLQPETQEDYHRTGDNLLAWRDEFIDAAAVHALAPGDALYVPYAAPHWVRVGAQPSISLSLTWQSRWSHCNGDALLLNHALRQKRLATFPIPAWPETAVWRSRFYRAARRLALL